MLLIIIKKINIFNRNILKNMNFHKFISVLKIFNYSFILFFSVFFYISEIQAQNPISLEVVNSSKIILPFQKKFTIKIKFYNISDSISYFLCNTEYIINNDDTTTNYNLESHKFWVAIINNEGYFEPHQYMVYRKLKTKHPISKKKLEKYKKTKNLMPNTIIIKPRNFIIKKYHVDLTYAKRKLGWYRFKIFWGCEFKPINKDLDSLQVGDIGNNVKVSKSISQTKWVKFLYLNLFDKRHD